MSDDDQPVLPAEPFWTSPVFRAGLVALLIQGSQTVPKFFAWIGWTNPAQISMGADLIINSMTFGAIIWVLRKRAKNATAPLTLTRKGAEAHPNTALAAAQTVTVSVPPTNGDMQ